MMSGSVESNSSLKQSKGKILINVDLCKGCYLCIDACPKHLIRPSNRISKFGYYPAEFFDLNGDCTGCSLCAIVCPDVAVEVYKTKK